MKPRLTLASLARLAGVSISTASLVLNGKAREQRICPETCARVQAAAAKHGYEADFLARSLRTGSTATLGVIFPDLRNHFDAACASALSREAWARGFQLFVADSHGDPALEAEQLRVFVARRVDGILLASTQSRLPKLKARVPVVLFDREVAGGVSVSSNHREAARDLILRLIDAGHFARGLVYLGGTPGVSTNEERFKGVQEACRARRLKAGVLRRVDGDFSCEWGARAAGELFGAAAPPPAIFTASFTLLQGALGWWQAERPGETPPPLASFDDHPLLDLLPFPVSSIAQDYTGLARAACALLLDQKGRGASTVIPAILHFRHSS